MSDTDLLSEAGWAIRRNGSCLPSAQETDCGETRAPYHACCPSSTVCPEQYNVACCPWGENCTSTLVAGSAPRCANASWLMFDNAGFFCCERGQVGYNYSNTDGCSASGAALPEGALPLAVVDQVAVNSSSSSSSSTSTAPSVTLTSATSGTSATASSSPGNNTGTASTGVIAGSVVGGVAFLAIVLVSVWLFLRRKNQKKEEKKEKEKGSSSAVVTAGDGSGSGGETSLAAHSEVTGYHSTAMKEEARPIEIDGTMPPVELSAVERPHELPVREG